MKHLDTFALLFLLHTSFFISPADKKEIQIKTISIVAAAQKVLFTQSPQQIIIGFDETPAQGIIIKPIDESTKNIDEPVENTLYNKGVYLVDWNQNKILNEVTQENIFPDFHLNPNKDTLALTSTLKTVVCNLNGEQLWENNKELCGSVFTPQGVLYVITKDGKIYNNHNNSEIQLPLPTGFVLGELIAHNNKEKIFFAKAGKTDFPLYTINFTNPKNPQVTLKKMPLLRPSIHNVDTPILKSYSPFGKLMAIYWAFIDTWSIYNYKTNKQIREIDCRSLCFNPTKASHVFILTKDGCIQECNIETNQTRIITKQSLGNPDYLASFNSPVIDVSTDGKHIAVIVKDTCYVLSNFD